MQIQPKHDYVLIRCEPFKEKQGGLFILAHHQRVRHGEVLAVGPGRYKVGTDHRVPVPVSVGERVAFFRENMEHQQGKSVKTVLLELGEELGADLALIRSSDILMGVEAHTVVSA